MPKFNADLSNLFKNYQQEQKYNKKVFDANGDGKIDSKDKNLFSTTEKNLKNNKNLFDVNGDGKFNQADIDIFLKGDVDGNGKITQEELNFIAKYKSELTKAFQDKKADFTLDNKVYKAGVLYFTNNYKGTDTAPAFDAKNMIITFTNKTTGKKTTVKVNNGENIVVDESGCVNITSKNGKTVSRYYIGGSLQYSLTNNYPTDKTDGPIKDGKTIKFSNGQTVPFENGESAVINSDGSVNITSKDGKTNKFSVSNGSLVKTGPTKDVSGCDVNEITKYDKNGNVESNTIRVWQRTYKTEYVMNSIPEDMDVSKITKVSSNKDGTFSITADGKIYTFQRTSGRSGYTEYNNATVTGPTINASGCDVNQITKYDANGNVESNTIRVWQRTYNIEWQISPIPNEMDTSKITKVSSNNDGTFSVTFGGKVYNFKSFIKNNYNKETGNLTDTTIRDANGKIESYTIYRNGYTTTHTGYDENGNWTTAIRKNDDGSRVEYSRVYNADGSFFRKEEKYDENNKLIAKSLVDYDSAGREQTSLRWDDGDNRYHCRIYVYDENGNVLYRPRISYNVDTYNSYVNNTKKGKDAYTAAYETFLKEVKSTNVDLSDAIAIFDNGIGNNNMKPVEVKVYKYCKGDDDGLAANITEKKANGSVVTAKYYITQKDENGYYQWKYEWSDNSTEYWNYNSSGSRESLTIYNSNGLQVTIYSTSGKSICRLSNLDPNKYELKAGNILYFNGKPYTGKVGNYIFENGKLKS